MDSIDDLHAAANVRLARGDTAGAVQAFLHLAATFPTDKNAVLSAAQGLRAARDPAAAVSVLEAALVHMPASLAVLDGLAAAYLEAARPAEAVKVFERMADQLEAKAQAAPRDIGAWTAVGTIRARLGRWSGAAAAFRQAVALGPSDTNAHFGLAQAEMSLGRMVAAEDLLRRTLALAPGHVQARALLSDIEAQARIDTQTLLQEAWKADEANLYGPARAKYEAALRKDPGQVLAISRLLTMDGVEGRLDDADVRHRVLAERLEEADLQSLNWRHLAAIAYQTVLRPLPHRLYNAVVAALDGNLIAEAGPPRRTEIKSAEGRRLKIGYLSTFLRDHPVGHVTAALFAAHDRARFDVHVYFCPDGLPNRYTQIIARGAEHFVTTSSVTGPITDMIAAGDLDILIYLDGYMALPLLPVVAARPAPIQVFWLGHAGGCDISGIDYLLADATVVRPEEEGLYKAKVVRLPGAFYCASPHAVAKPPTRAEAGLPEAAFVFCAFNNPEKIDRTVFESWMRILARVEGSVLWLSQTLSAMVTDNLRTSAAALGIDGGRLIFATRLPDKAQHLAR
ncbi:MAG: O-linked N-acetylglucosamine transferase, SPINDLY family protein, partial [Rhodospirillaceae bacterium]